ncbi:MAG: rhodanese-like domain-containing protein [Mariprofundaceae bacterium]
MKGSGTLRGIGLAIAMLLPVWASACGVGEQTPEGYENAPVAHVYQHWKQGDASPIPFVLIDVRTPEEYAGGHIEGAKLIPVQELADRLNEVPKDRQVYVYCRSGRRSARAAALLAKHGFTRIENMVGGIEAWTAAGYPVVGGGGR